MTRVGDGAGQARVGSRVEVKTMHTVSNCIIVFQVTSNELGNMIVIVVE